MRTNMSDPHFCQNCQFCVPIFGKNKEVLRIECWRFPPVPIVMGTDPEGKSRIGPVRPRVEANWKCGEWKEKMMGFW